MINTVLAVLLVLKTKPVKFYMNIHTLDVWLNHQ